MTPRTLTTALVLLAATLLAAPTAMARPAEDDATATLHREIAALRIVHGLDLSAAQLEELVPLVRAGIDLREEFEGVMEASARANISVLERVRDDLADDGELSEETETAAEDAHKATEKATRPVHWELQDLGEEVMALLDDEQKEKVTRALARPPFGPDRRGGPRQGESGERMGPPDRPMQPGVAQGVRRHNARQLFGVVFSDEFLGVLQDSL
jgi:hypothetical protein